MLKKGSADDIYWWCTSIPDEVAPPVTDGAERIIREIGFHKIGYCKDLPQSRRRKTGIYVHDMWAADPQVGWVMMKIGRKFIIEAKAENCRTLFTYMKKNHEKIAKEICGKEISEF